MPDIFLSYNREDQVAAGRFAQGFARHGLVVWWDTTLRAGDAYDEVTEQALRDARAVVVLWSQRSVLSRWVRAEATIAARQNTLVPCTIEPCQRPIMFELTQTADLSHWQGDDEDPAWRAFLGDVTRLVGQTGPAGAQTIATPAAAKIAPVESAIGHAVRAAPVTEQERRHLTLLSARLGQNAPGHIDPEEWHDIISAFQASVEPILAEYGGTARWRRDELTAIFGYPVAHEDAAERAVRAGLAIAARHPTASVAIHAGTVLIAPGNDGEMQLFGDAPDLAAAARAEATPGQVVVTAIVHGLVEDAFDTAPQGSLHRILRATVRAAARITRFVGREDETWLLNSRWRRVVEGDGQHLLIKGEPGIGKTRLVGAFRDGIADQPHRWIDWAGASLFANTPFHALIQSFSRLLEDEEGDRFAALRRVLTLNADAAPLVAEMMGIPLPAGQVSPGLGPVEQRRRLLSAMAEWVFSMTRQRPVVIAIDDLQWIDPSTMELVQILVEQGATAPLMIIGTARPEFRPVWPERAHHAQINLGRLGDRQIRELVAAGNTRLDESVIEAVMKRADGVPLFAEELTRLLAEGAAQTMADIPATLRDSLAARLDRLGPAKDIAQRAAVLGREFSYGLLRTISNTDDATLNAALTALADAELIHARGTPPRATYQFKHALVQDSAYAALTRSRRRSLHGEVARIIVAQFPEIAASSPELLASHWSRAGEPIRSVAAWYAAGNAAYARRAFKEAEAQFREGLAELAKSPENAERDASELALYSGLNRVLQLTQGYAAPETIAAATRGRELAEKSGSLADLIREEVRMWRAIITSGDYAAATALADHILDLSNTEGANNSDNAARMIFAYNAQVQTRYFTGDLMGVERYFALLTPLIELVGDKQAPGNNNIAIGIGSLAAGTRGDRAEAEARISRAFAFAERTGNPYDRACALHYHGNLTIMYDDVEKAGNCAAQLVELSDANGFFYLASHGRSLLGYVQAMRGDVAGLTMMRGAIDYVAGTGAHLGRTLLLTRLAEGQARLGDSIAARTTIDEALAANPQELINLLRALEFRASLLQAAGEIEGAREDNNAAMALIEVTGANIFRDTVERQRAALH